MLTEQKNKTAKLFQFTATTSSPWDEVQFNFWKHKVTNMVLSSIRLALSEDSKSDVNKLLFATGEHNNVTVSSGDKRNISGLLICHPILLDSPFVEPAGIDQLLDDLLLERHPYTVAQASDGSGSYESDKAHVKIATLKASAHSSRLAERVSSRVAHIPRVPVGSHTGGTGKHLSCLYPGEGRSKSVCGGSKTSRSKRITASPALCEGYSHFSF